MCEIIYTYIERGRVGRVSTLVADVGLSGKDSQRPSELRQLLHRNVQRFRGGLVFKAHRLLHHSALGLRVIKKEKKERERLSVMQKR